MMTLAVAGTSVSGSSWVISVQLILTLATAGWVSTRARVSFWIWARSGQPEVVSAITMSSSPMMTPLAMPS